MHRSSVQNTLGTFLSNPFYSYHGLRLNDSTEYRCRERRIKELKPARTQSPFLLRCTYLPQRTYTYLSVLVSSLFSFPYLILTIAVVQLVAATHLQRAPASGLAPHSLSWIQQPVSPSQAAQINETNRRLQSLQVERECLKIRQQEIRQVRYL